MLGTNEIMPSDSKKLSSNQLFRFFFYVPYPLLRMLNNDTHKTVNLKEISLNSHSACIHIPIILICVHYSFIQTLLVALLQHVNAFWQHLFHSCSILYINCSQYTDIHFVKLKNSKTPICPKTWNAHRVFHSQTQCLHCFKGKGLQ